MKKVISIILSCIIVANVCCLASFADEENTVQETTSNMPQILAKDLPDEYIVMDAETGDVLIGVNQNNKVMAGSMTSIMTSLLLLENGNEQDKVTSPSSFATPPGSSIAIDVSEEFTIEQLIHALVLSSANDAAMTLAYHKANSLEDFVQMMNDKAASLEMKDTVFASVYTSEIAEQMTSVNDVAIMLKEAMKFSCFRKAYSAKEYVIPPTNKKDVARNYIKQTNSYLLDNGAVMDYMGSVANIYDKDVLEADLSIFSNGKYIMFTSINFKKMPLIFVSSGSGDSNIAYAKHKALMEKIKNEYASYTVIQKGELAGSLELKDKEKTKIKMFAAKNVDVILPKNIDIKTELIKEVNKRDLTNVVIDKGTKLGELVLKFQGRELAKVDLVSDNSMGKSSFLGDISDVKEETPFEKVMSFAGLIIKILLIILIWTFVVAKRRERLRKASVEKKDNTVIDFKTRRK